MNVILEFFIRIISQFIEIMEFEVYNYNGYSITWLNILIVCTILPIIFSLLKVSFGEVNKSGDFNLVSDIKGIAYNNAKNKKGKQ